MNVAKYRKTALIEAVLLTDDNGAAVAAWCGGTLRGGPGGGSKGGSVIIDALEGREVATPGCYVAKGIDGEFWPIQGDIFQRTYEVVPDV